MSRAEADVLVAPLGGRQVRVGATPARVRGLIGTGRDLLMVGALSLILRLVFCFAVVPLVDLNLGPRSHDFLSSTDGYIVLAENIRNHGRFSFAPADLPTTYRAPLFPAVVAAAYWLIDDLGAATLLVNCVAAALTSCFVYCLAHALFGRGVALGSGLAASLFPLSVYYSAQSWSDTLISLTYVAYGCCIVLLAMRRTTALVVLSGIAFGLAALSKPVILPIPVCLVAYSAFKPGLFKPMVLSAVVGMCCVLPWTYRNFTVSGEVVPVCGGLGYNLLVGNFMIEEGSDCNASYSHGIARAKERILRVHDLEPAQAALKTNGHLDLSPALDRVLGRSALAMFVEEPTLLIRKICVNAARFWYFSSTSRRSLVNGVVNGGVLFLAVWGALRAWRGPNQAGLEALGVVIFSLIGAYVVVIIHSSRFSLPVMFLLLPLACFAISRTREPRDAVEG